MLASSAYSMPHSGSAVSATSLGSRAHLSMFTTYAATPSSLVNSFSHAMNIAAKKLLNSSGARLHLLSEPVAHVEPVGEFPIIHRHTRSYAVVELAYDR